MCDKVISSFFFLIFMTSRLCGADFFSYIPSTDLQRNGTMRVEATFETDPSLWANWFDVDEVARKRLVHSGEMTSQNWSIGIGKGSQIFSFQGEFGEAIPPQNHPGAPWIDEVVQIVAVNRHLNNRRVTRTIETYYKDSLGNDMIRATSCRDSAWFVHQAGAYQRDTVLLDNTFYSPILADYQDNNTYGTVCWPQQAHAHSIFTSDLLYWQRIRDCGSGIIEITYAIYNYGETIVDYLNLPWGGVRESTLPVHILSKPDGSWEAKDGRFGDGLLENLSNTGGWALFAQNENPDALALSYVFGRDKHLGKAGYEAQWAASRWRYGRGAPLAIYPGMENRDFFVGVVNPRIEIRKGEMFYWRWFAVVGKLDSVIAESNMLADSVDYGLLSFRVSEAEKIPVYYDGQSYSTKGVGTRIGELYDRPVHGAAPVFVMENKTDNSITLTQNPNEFNDSLLLGIGMVYRPYLSRYRCTALLGFGSEKQMRALQNTTTVKSKINKDVFSTPEVYSHKQRIVFNPPDGTKSITVHNLRGQLIKKFTEPFATTFSWKYTGTSSVLLVRLVSENRTVSRRVFVMR
ncbi:hypothetical protein CHISP_0677 [Chitinispirillum alkaliphilum]|nr:hypothetical protein CHISP_0677 [Chitinispirillum alkaliphilum]